MGKNWFKSSFSGSDKTCVEVRFDADTVLIRDSKYQGDPATQPVITVPSADWSTFLRAALGIQQHLNQNLPTIDRHPSGEVSLRAADHAILTYTAAEWTAFTAGVGVGEFELAAA